MSEDIIKSIVSEMASLKPLSEDFVNLYMDLNIIMDTWANACCEQHTAEPGDIWEDISTHTNYRIVHDFDTDEDEDDDDDDIWDVRCQDPTHHNCHDEK